MEEISGIPFRVKLGYAGNAQAQVGLFEVPLVRIDPCIRDRRWALSRHRRPVEGRKGRGDLLDQFLVPRAARHGQEDAVRTVAAVEIL